LICGTLLLVYGPEENTEHGFAKSKCMVKIEKKN
jgi:hypothetical protein